MVQRTIVITGASDGIGAAAARQLTENGREVVVVGRSPRKTEAVARGIGGPFHVADFTDLARVRSLAEELKANHPPSTCSPRTPAASSAPRGDHRRV